MTLLKAEKICRDCYGERALKEISFEISEKGIYGFLGKSDSGKSELARLLAGISEPDAGELWYKERQMFVSEKQTASIKKKIGYVPEKCFFDANMTALESLDFMGKVKNIDPDKRFRQIKEALELTGLSHRSNALVSSLSLSEQKRLSIAASLIGNPDVVIMDEPLKYIDRAQEQDIRNLIELLGKKKVVLLFCSRSADVESLCTYTAIIAGGRIAVWSSLEDILQTLKENGYGGLGDALEAFSDNIEEDE